MCIALSKSIYNDRQNAKLGFHEMRAGESSRGISKEVVIHARSKSIMHHHMLPAWSLYQKLELIWLRSQITLSHKLQAQTYISPSFFAIFPTSSTILIFENRGLELVQKWPMEWESVSTNSSRQCRFPQTIGRMAMGSSNNHHAMSFTRPEMNTKSLEYCFLVTAICPLHLPTKQQENI